MIILTWSRFISVGKISFAVNLSQLLAHETNELSSYVKELEVSFEEHPLYPGGSILMLIKLVYDGGL